MNFLGPKVKEKKMEKTLKVERSPIVLPAREGSFIDALLRDGILTPDQLHIAHIERLQSSKPLDVLLVEMGFLSSRLMVEAKAKATGYEKFDPQKNFIDIKLLKKLPRQEAESLKVLPLYEEGETLHVAACDPDDIRLFDRLKRFYPGACHFHVSLGTPEEILKALDDHYGHALSLKELLQTYDDPSLPHAQSRETIGVRFLQALFVDAVKQGASDIHFEPEERFVGIRYRLDGVLKKICAFHKQYWPMLCVRLKIMSEINIAESRLPQDGRFHFTVLGRDIDVRLSSLPSRHGENIVLRLLDKHFLLKTIEDLGLSPRHLQKLRPLLKIPEGLVIVTGPTGSGKTTTLYSMVQSLSLHSLNVMTLEDPIEYTLPALRQTEIQEPGGLTFPQGLRAILRQDPDVILVGEIRDELTARMALRASMTGHLVLTTVHAHDVFGVFPRLFDLGLTPPLLQGNLKGIISQRLLRKLCSACKKRTIIENRLLFAARGCPLCAHTGYKGRLMIAEILLMTEELEALLSLSTTAFDLKKHAHTQGFESLKKAALERVHKGETSLEEMERVIGNA